jgi:hypothetical protein
MRGKKTAGVMAAVAVGGALAIGGCGGGDSATGETAPAKAADGVAMKHEGDAMKQKNGDAMKDDSGANHAMKDDKAMKDDDGAMHGDNGAMKDDDEMHDEG